jgi:hypothetical protein
MKPISEQVKIQVDKLAPKNKNGQPFRKYNSGVQKKGEKPQRARYKFTIDWKAGNTITRYSRDFTYDRTTRKTVIDEHYALEKIKNWVEERRGQWIEVKIFVSTRPDADTSKREYHKFMRIKQDFIDVAPHNFRLVDGVHNVFDLEGYDPLFFDKLYQRVQMKKTAQLNRDTERMYDSNGKPIRGHDY